jgi:hypothetical protein
MSDLLAILHQAELGIGLFFSAACSVYATNYLAGLTQVGFQGKVGTFSYLLVPNQSQMRSETIRHLEY